MSTYTIGSVMLILRRGNIVDVEAEAIVNAANAALAGGGGVDGAIHRAAGPRIYEECRKIGGCPTGSAVATSAGKLKASYIFHAVGPIYRRQPDDARLLASAYQACLDLAEQHYITSIAFPALSTGAYGYPIHEATPIALRTVIEHIKKPTSLQCIFFVLFDEKLYKTYEKNLQILLPA
jgi:O-acetyl-ADP-ribose deacetylase